MNNEKIGKLIRELRRKNNLTQEQLADKVGVGFRAVSKWERGINAPELSNMYELCKIFNITKEELLSGELKEKDNNENNSKKKLTSHIIITISIIGVFIIALTSILIYQNNRTYTYKVVNVQPEEDYCVEGIVYFKKGKISFNINEMYFKNTEFTNTIIENYEYEITSNNKMIFGYGYIGTVHYLEKPISIQKFTEERKISFETPTKLTKESIIKNGIKLNFKFLTKDKDMISKELILELKEIN